MTVRRFTCDNPDYDLWDDSHGTFVRYDDYERLQTAARKALVCLNMFKDIGIVTFTSEAIDDLKKELEG